MLLEPPHFAFGAAPELGGVEQDAVVAAGAADFTGGEFGGVVDDPADRAVGHLRQLGIAATPVDRFFGGVDMDQLGPGFAQQKAADPGVAEQVQHFRVGRSLAHEIPLRGHVGEEAEVAEGGQAGMEADLAAGQWPIARHLAVVLPAAAAILVAAGDEGGIGIPVRIGRSPHRLGFGADDVDRAVAFEFLAVAAVDQGPIVPRFGDQGGEVGHAARASLPPIEARAMGPPSMVRATLRA